MKSYTYHEYSNDEAVVVNEDEILERYWDYWIQRMEEASHRPNSNAKRILQEALKERCIEDFCAVHWASEVNE